MAKKNSHFDRLLAIVAEAQKEFRSSDDAHEFVVQATAAIGTIVIGPWFQKSPPREEEFKALMGDIACAGFNAMVNAANSFKERN